MGGIQTVVVGDFYQLPPVPNKWTEDPGKYVFQSDLWDWIVPHKIIMSEIYRQTDTVFITAINELSRRCSTPDTMKYLKEADDNKERDISLHSRQVDVHLANIYKLLAEPGELKMYNAEKKHTNVCKKMRHSIDVPDTLALKVGCPAILTVNLSHRLVNGLRGTVKSLNDASVSVYFHDLRDTHEICGYNFFQHEPRTHVHVFVLKQIPLLLAYALTIHKSQGMTLPDVMVDCEGAFDPGQIAVAISSVKSISRITIKNLRAGLCPPYPRIINGFYGMESCEVEDDTSCCLMPYSEFMCEYDDDNGDVQFDSVSGSHRNNDGGTDCDLSDTGDEDEDDNRMVNSENDTDHTDGPIEYGRVGVGEREGEHIDDTIWDVCNDPDVVHPTCLTPDEMRKRLIISDPFHDRQVAINAAVNKVCDDDLHRLLKFFFYHLHMMFTRTCTKSCDPKQTNSLIHEFIHIFSQTDLFNYAIRHTFHLDQIDEIHLSIGVSLILRVQDVFF